MNPQVDPSEHDQKRPTLRTTIAVGAVGAGGGNAAVSIASVKMDLMRRSAIRRYQDREKDRVRFMDIVSRKPKKLQRKLRN